jgi:hypothetical protein
MAANPTVVILQQDAHGRHVKTREISLRDKEFAKVSSSFIHPVVFFRKNASQCVLDFVEARQCGNRGVTADSRAGAIRRSLDSRSRIHYVPLWVKLCDHRTTHYQGLVLTSQKSVTYRFKCFETCRKAQ